jgi:hypothetical protein
VGNIAKKGGVITPSAEAEGFYRNYTGGIVIPIPCYPKFYSLNLIASARR